MNILCAIAVIYVVADLAICAFVVYRRGGFRQTWQEVRNNLGIEPHDNYWRF